MAFLADATTANTWPIAAVIAVGTAGSLYLLRLDADPVELTVDDPPVAVPSSGA